MSQSAFTCPLCRSPGTVPFYEIPSVPVSCAAIFATRADALAVPRGALQLAVCQHCGLVFNAAFDERLGAISARYESSQAASAHFSAFARSLARDWIERYSLQGRTVLEVGCGGGDFLRLLVQEGVARGIGIDPCCEPDGGVNTTWIVDMFDQRYVTLDADALVCRHTLEHVRDVENLLALMRDWALQGKDRVLLFELPASERIFAERAFWDVYYEHCNYFTADTLRFAFERNGFEILRISHAYDGQYLVLEAAPALHAEPRVPGNAQATIAECQAFASEVRQSIDRFATRARALTSAKTPLALWQGASKTVGLLTALGDPDWIAYAVDLSPQRHDKFLPGSGLPVYAPDKLLELRPRDIVLMNPVYLTEVQTQVRDMGLDATVRPVNELLS